MLDEKALSALEAELFLGRDLIEVKDGGFAFAADRESYAAFCQLRARAREAGLDLSICSAYRSFVRQHQIFKDKYEGRRPVLDALERPMDISKLTAQEKIAAITYFSALPGLSRHHLGTDFDVYAVNLLPPGQRLQLTYHEYEPGAYFYPLGQFLAREAASFGFSRPFMQQAWRGGPEPWHLSFKERAAKLLDGFSLSRLNALYDLCTDDFVSEMKNFAAAHYRSLLCIA